MPIIPRLAAMFNSYRENVVLRFRHKTAADEFVNATFKWSFDVTKNFITLVAVRAIAIKLNSADILLLSNLLTFIFSGYVTNCVLHPLLSIIYRPESRILRTVVVLVVVAPLAIVCGIALSLEESKILAELVAIQTK